jgi:DNA-binding transcriptional regulator YhcF (GntR family)
VLPPIRQLARDLGLATGTVARAVAAVRGAYRVVVVPGG